MLRSFKLDTFVIFFIGLAVFTVGLSHQEVIGFEARFYLFALEMWRHGLSWFPTTYQTYYPDYPVTSTALIYLTAKVWGHLDKLTAVFPSAAAAALTLVATYRIAAIHSRCSGWYSVAFLLLTSAVVMEARTISLDIFVMLFTTLSFYAVYSAESKNKAIPYVQLVLFFMMSFAIRGPIGLIIPASVVCVFYLSDKNISAFFKSGFTAFFTLLVCSVVLFAIAKHAGNDAFMREVLRMQVMGRMEGAAPPWNFYFIENIGAYAVTYPLALLILAGCVFLPHSKNKLMLKLAGWVLIILVGMSLTADKKVRYVLSIAPALALICGHFFATQTHVSYLRWLRKMVYVFLLLLPFICLISLPVLQYKKIPLNYVVLGLGFSLTALFSLIDRRRAAVLFSAVVAFLIAVIFVSEPIELNLNQTRSFVEKVENFRLQQQLPLVFYREDPDGLVIKYLADMPVESTPAFVSDVREIKHPALVIAEKNDIDAMPVEIKQHLHVVSEGKIGHVRVSAFIY